MVYDGSILLSQRKTIDYINPSGRTDSSISTGFSSSILNGIQSREPFSSIVVYNHYDANGNNLLDSSYDLLNSRKAVHFFQNTYSGNSLTSQKSFSGNGTPNSVAYWQNGNMVSDSVYANGILNIALSFTFLPTLSGEFSNISGYRNLLGSITQVNLLINENRVQTLNYTFDKSNRVSAVSFMNSSGKLYEKDVYTYY